MRASRVISAVDSHTEGMPTRVVTGGVGPVPGTTMLARKTYFETEMDDLRLALMREPRGHAAMSGAILQPPIREDADWGVIFIEVTGCLPMCGHGTIGVATVLVETGMVEVREPETVIRIDAPAGLVVARVAVEDGRAKAVTLRNVASFSFTEGRTLEIPTGRVSYDMAYGGNFYALVEAADVGLRIEAEQGRALLETGEQILAAIEAGDRPVHPEDPVIAGCNHVVFHEAGREGSDARSATVIHPGYFDRSPCGTGTSARMAQLHAGGRLDLGEPFVNESPIGSRFTGRLVEEVDLAGRKAVVPELTGRAWITGTAQYLLDDDDPFPTGFSL